MARYHYSVGPCARKICKHLGTEHDDRSGCSICICVSYDPTLSAGNILKATFAVDPWNQATARVRIEKSSRTTVKMTFLDDISAGTKFYGRGSTVEWARNKIRFEGV